jgi:hypothetical protein
LIESPFLERCRATNGKIAYKDGGKKKEAAKRCRMTRRSLQRALGIDGPELTSDEFDAVLCAVTAAFRQGQLGGAELRARLIRTGAWPRTALETPPPVGYVLLAVMPPGTITLKPVTAIDLKACLEWARSLRNKVAKA